MFIPISKQDDFVRHLHSFNYKFLAETDGDNYPRFALYTLGGANYNYVQYPFFAYGMGEQNQFVADEKDAVVPIEDVIVSLPDFFYAPEYFQVDAPVGCGQMGKASCWFTMLTNPTTNLHQRAHRGIVVRNFHGRLNGEAWPPAGIEVSPFTFSLIKSRNNNPSKNTVSLELGLPNDFLVKVEKGEAKFLEGDYLAGDLELLLPPRQTGDYYGRSQRLKDWMAEAGVDSDFKNGWKITAKEASMGDDIVTKVFAGTLERRYHPRIQVDSADEARFNLKIPAGMPGILPITISGVEATKSFSSILLERPSGKLWRFVGSWEEFGEGGDYQLEKDVLDNSYTFVYSLRLEFDVVGDCEQFAFQPEAPFIENGNCDIVV